MMRITAQRGEGQVVRLHVEGRLTSAVIGELKDTCDAATRGGSTVLLDLSGVQYVDSDAVALIERLRERGAVVIGCSAFVAALLRGGDGQWSEQEPAEVGLAERLRAGDGEAYEEVVRCYGGRLLATARRMLGSDEAAEDAVQEAFLSAFRHIEQFQGTARLSTWLHRIIVNVALMRMRSRRARPEVAIEDLLPRFDAEGAWADRIAGSDQSTDVLLERVEIRRLVRGCIERLPVTYRTVLLMRDIEELDTDEAAVLLGVTPNAVKVRLHRARQALRTLIERALLAGEHPAELCAAS